MHRLIVQIDDSLVEKVMNYLRSLPSKKVKLLRDEKVPERKRGIDFGRYRIPSLQTIDDPLQWQKKLRSEWE